MSAGARIIQEGGTLILACECREGVPANSPLDKLLRSAGTRRRFQRCWPRRDLSARTMAGPNPALIQRKARVLVLQLAAR